jgi:hypothetical protein
MLYLHASTGLLIVSNKMAVSPFVPLSTFFLNIPTVIYRFGNAIFPPFLVLAAIGFRKVEGKYRSLLILLIVVHLLGRSLVGHSTFRYSVEFIPLCMLFAAQGAPVICDYLGGVSARRLASGVIGAVILFFGVWQAETPARPDRALLKEAGLFLRSAAPGSVIAARLPITAFYAQGTAVLLADELTGGSTTADRLDRIIATNNVEYVVVDEELEENVGFLKGYVAELPLLKEFATKGFCVRIYRTNSKAESLAKDGRTSVLSSNSAR